jgi:hypothetical protein
MPLRFVLDEPIRGGGLWQALQQHNAHGVDAIDAVRVGDSADLPLRSPDTDVLVWAELHGRILISSDKSTLPKHRQDHLQMGRHSPGILCLRPGFTIPVILGFLLVAAHAGEPGDFADMITYFP